MALTCSPQIVRSAATSPLATTCRMLQEGREGVGERAMGVVNTVPVSAAIQTLIVLLILTDVWLVSVEAGISSWLACDRCGELP